jgi:hypothetical protein
MGRLDETAAEQRKLDQEERILEILEEQSQNVGQQIADIARQEEEIQSL